MPMAMDSSPLMNALLAWAAGHINCFDNTFTSAASEYRSSALISVASSLPSSYPASQLAETETTLAACLVLCSAEISTCASNGWYDHLMGAKGIIESAVAQCPGGVILRGTECFMRTQDGQWLLRDFAYHDVLGSVTMGCEPLIKGRYWIPGDQPVLDAYVGVGSEILAMISEICCLKTEVDETAVFTGWDEQDDVLQGLLQNSGAWQPFFRIESQLKQWDCLGATNEYLIELAESYRCAALICLYRKARDFFPWDTPRLDELIAEQVRELVALFEIIPYQSMPEGGLLFPVFIAGGETMDNEFIAIIRTRLQGFKAHRGFTHISLAEDVLEELWRLKKRNVTGPDGKPVDWMDILRRRGLKLMLH